MIIEIEVPSTRPWPVTTGLGSAEYGGPLAEEEREERDFVRAALALRRAARSLTDRCGQFKTTP